MAGQWYMAIGGHQVGPVSEDEIRTNLVNGSIDANTLLFTAGMANWTPLSAVPQFAAALKPARRRARRRSAARPDAARTTSISRSSARTCSSSRWSSIPARAPWPRPAR